jgi:hypothetical protein
MDLKIGMLMLSLMHKALQPSSFPLACTAFQYEAFSHTQSPITHKLKVKPKKKPQK